MNKKQLFLVVLLGWALQVAMRFLKRALARALGFALEPRLCPSCGYRQVKDVRVHRSRPGEPPWAYCYCGACRRRYKHKGEGPLYPVDDDEWLRKTGMRIR